MTDKIEALVTNFVRELTAMIDDAARERMLKAIGGPSKPGRGRRVGGSQHGGSRTQRIAGEKKDVLEAIKRHPGSKAEEIASAAGLDTKVASARIKALISDKLVDGKGETRGRVYSPTSGSATVTSNGYSKVKPAKKSKRRSRSKPAKEAETKAAVS